MSDDLAQLTYQESSWTVFSKERGKPVSRKDTESDQSLLKGKEEEKKGGKEEGEMREEKS